MSARPMNSRLTEAMVDQVGFDPVTKALVAPLREAVTDALDHHVPRLAFGTAEVAGMLGCSTASVNELVKAGRLSRVAGPQSPISIGSILHLVDWPLADAPVSAPLSVVPAAGGVS